MKRLMIFVVALSAVSAGAAFARLGDVVASFPAPANNPIALAFCGMTSPYYIYVYCRTSPYWIYKLDAINGSVYSSFISPQGPYTRGLTYSYGGGGGLPTGNYLWMGNYYNDHIYRCNPDNGSVYALIPANHDMSGGLAVMARDAGYQPTFMLSNDTSPRYVFRQSLTSGSVYSSFAPSQPLYDLAWEGPNDLVWGGNTGNGVYAYTTTGRFIESFTMPVNNVAGLTYRSQYLYVGTTTGSHRIWVIHCPNNRSAVHPASVGRVKALFR
jgi:hypothetical protein